MRGSVNIVQPGRQTALPSDSVAVLMNTHFYLCVNDGGRNVHKESLCLCDPKNLLHAYYHVFTYSARAKTCHLPAQGHSYAWLCLQHISVIAHSLFAGKSCGREVWRRGRGHLNAYFVSMSGGGCCEHHLAAQILRRQTFFRLFDILPPSLHNPPNPFSTYRQVASSYTFINQSFKL